jgi:molybdenum cofactor guanylyltransferase
MRLLGAIIADGASRRFGSDKAQALIDGRTLLNHAVMTLAPQVDDVVLCGRTSDQLHWICDRPVPGQGPLGGINAALTDAYRRGYDAVITVPVDVFPLPSDLASRLAALHPRVFATQYLIGRWPVTLAPLREMHLAAGHRSLRSWITAAQATCVEDRALGLRNINLREDLVCRVSSGTERNDRSHFAKH